MRIHFVLLATLSLFVLGNTYQRRMFTFRRHAQTFEFKTLCFNNSTFKWTTHPRLKKDSNGRILVLILLPNKDSISCVMNAHNWYITNFRYL